MPGKKLIRGVKYKPDSDKSELVRFFSEIGDIVFGQILPSEDTEIPELETKESASQRQKGQGLKILTPKQLITRLPVLLAQLKARNNSEKLKNEIRQIAYSLYRSKNLSKTVYNNLINTV